MRVEGREKGTNGVDLSFKVVEILIERVAVQLYARQFVDRGSSDPERFLETFQNSFPISIRLLQPRMSSLHQDKMTELTLSALPSRPITSVCHHK